ncbi:MAG: DUF2244 domain-containing protein [Pseudomonadota bacterium]
MTQDPTRIEAWPNRSLSSRGFATFILVTYGLFLLPLISLMGTAALWGVLPFILLALFLVWMGFMRSYRDGRLIEVLTLAESEVALTRTDPDGKQQTWSANPYWVQVHIHEKGGPVPGYVTLKGGGREVEMGAFLSEEERRALYDDLRRLLG